MLQARNSKVAAMNATNEVKARFIAAGWDVNPSLIITSVKLTYASGSNNSIILCQCECADKNGNTYDVSYKLSDIVAVLTANGDIEHAQSLLRELHVDALGRKQRFSSLQEIEEFLKFQDAKAGKPLQEDYAKAAIVYARQTDEHKYLRFLESEVATVLNNAKVLIVDHEYSVGEIILDQWGNPLTDLRTATKVWHRDYLIGIEIANEKADILSDIELSIES